MKMSRKGSAGSSKGSEMSSKGSERCTCIILLCALTQLSPISDGAAEYRSGLSHGTASPGSRSAWKSGVERQRKHRAVETQGKGTVLATSAVETHKANAAVY